jgi:hypothetical protein
LASFGYIERYQSGGVKPGSAEISAVLFDSRLSWFPDRNHYGVNGDTRDIAETKPEIALVDDLRSS